MTKETASVLFDFDSSTVTFTMLAHIIAFSNDEVEAHIEKVLQEVEVLLKVTVPRKSRCVGGGWCGTVSGATVTYTFASELEFSDMVESAAEELFGKYRCVEV